MQIFKTVCPKSAYQYSGLCSISKATTNLVHW